MAGGGGASSSFTHTEWRTSVGTGLGFRRFMGCAEYQGTERAVLVVPVAIIEVLLAPYIGLQGFI